MVIWSLAQTAITQNGKMLMVENISHGRIMTCVLYLVFWHPIILVPKFEKKKSILLLPYGDLSLLVPSCFTSNRKLKLEATGHRTMLYLITSIPVDLSKILLHTMQTLTRRRFLWRLILVCIVCSGLPVQILRVNPFMPSVPLKRHWQTV